MTKKLRAAAGTNEASIGETEYPIPEDGIIEVPDEDADALIANGGFSLVDDQTDPSSEETPPADISGLVPVKGEPGSSCSVRGTSYEADASGIINVPAFAVAELLAHGFEAA